MDIKELKVALASKGWTEDRFGHFKREIPYDDGGTVRHRTYRVKVAKLSVRIERQYTVEETQYSPAKKDWIKIDGAYLKDIKVREDGGLVIGKKVLK